MSYVMFVRVPASTALISWISLGSETGMGELTTFSDSKVSKKRKKKRKEEEEKEEEK